TRYEIEKFLEAEGRDFRTDSTNEQTDYTRNKIRHNVMPVLLEINPGAIKHFANLSNMQDMAVEYIDSQVDKAYGKYVTEASVSRKDGTENPASKEYMTEASASKEILNEELIIVKSVIKKVLTNVAKTAKDIASVHIDAVYDLMCGGVGRSVDLPYGMKAVSDYESVTIMKVISDYESVTIMKSDGEAQKSKKEAEDGLSKETAKLNIKNIANIEPDILDIGDSEEVEFNGTKFRLSIIAFDSDMEITSKTYTKMLDYDKITDRLCIRSRKEGDYIVINDKGSKKSLKRYMIDEKIPARERDIWPIVCDGAHVMYVAGNRISEYYKIDDSTKRVLVIEVITNNL
nr:tRNA lysidine(34) synthetase TilS [Lachnospiraceae bacterium]